MATADLAEDSRDVGVGDTPQGAVGAAQQCLGEPRASEMAAGWRANEKASETPCHTDTWKVFDVVAGDEILVGRGSARVENADGAWVGTTQRYAVGYGVEEGMVVWELVGEGGYEGLAMYLWGDYLHKPEELWGIIVPSSSVPETPEPPPLVGAE